MVMNRRGSVFLLVAWCLLSAWLLYGGLELAEELKLVVKNQPSAHDLDMEALLQLASGLKPDVPTIENRSVVSRTPEAVESSPLIPTHTIFRDDNHTVPDLPSLRLHQFLSVYRI